MSTISGELQPKLKGTYDSYLSMIGRDNAVTMQYRLGSQNDKQVFTQKGSFEVAQEDLNSILADFRRLSENSQAGLSRSEQPGWYYTGGTDNLRFACDRIRCSNSSTVTPSLNASWTSSLWVCGAIPATGGSESRFVGNE